jgi:hypothetical protein
LPVQTPAIALAVPNDQPAGALREPHVLEIERGKPPIRRPVSISNRLDGK